MDTYQRQNADAPVEKIIAHEEEISEWQRVCDRHAKGNSTAVA
jgi:hypothetical protein